MSVRAQRRSAERGQALILALVLLGTISVVSVSLLRLASASVGTASSVRQAAYRDGAREAGGLMARQLVADGLGCTASPMTAQVAGETVTVAVKASPANCPTPDPGDGDGGTAPGPYVLCTTVSAPGGPYPATVTVAATQPGGSGTPVNVDIVHLAYGPC
ncbi:MAG TPA: hypothetical protein VI316_09325 [Candidatus Dormibacteraeota bacterium]